MAGSFLPGASTDVAPFGHAIAHAAQTDAGNLEAGLSQAHVVHRLLPQDESRRQDELSRGRDGGRLMGGRRGPSCGGLNLPSIV